MALEWIKRDGKLLYVETTTVEKILFEQPLVEYQAQIAAEEKAITEFDQKKYLDSLKASVDYKKEIIATAVNK